MMTRYDVEASMSGGDGGTGRWVLAAAVGVALVCAAVAPEHAHAQETTARKRASARKPLAWSWGAGARMALVSSFISPPDISPVVNPPVPTFLGEGGGGGIVGHLLWEDIVGLELGLTFISANASGTYTYILANEELSVGQELSSDEIHLPILIRGQIPLPYVKPYLALGATLVWQTSTAFSVTNPRVTTAIPAPSTESYPMLTTALGAAVDLGTVRVPIELRAMYQNLERNPEARATYDFYSDGSELRLSRYSVRSAWEAQFLIMVGVEYWGHFRL